MVRGNPPTGIIPRFGIKPTLHNSPVATSAQGPLPSRGRVSCQGYVTSVRILSSDQKPQYEATVLARPLAFSAGSETTKPDKVAIRLVWLGQRRVPGLDAGVKVRFEGMLCQHDGKPTIYNPWYEILGRPELSEDSPPTRRVALPRFLRRPKPKPNA